MAYCLQPAETPQTGVPRILLEEMAGIIHDLVALPDGRDLAIHQSRKRFKRLRAALRLVRGSITTESYQAQNRFFRDQSRQLSPARDSAVLVETLVNLKDHFADELPEASFSALHSYLQARHERISRDLYLSGVMVEVAARLQVRLPMISALSIAADQFDCLAGGIQNVYRRGRRLMVAAYKLPHDPHIFHDWRKRVKYLWHHCEILQLVWPPFFVMWGDALHHLSDILGVAHDLIVLQELLITETVPPASDAALLVTLIDRRCTQLEQMAQSLGQRLYGEKPAAFVNRLGSYWVARQADLPELTASFSANKPMLPELLSPGELATRYDCAAEQVRALIHRGMLPAVRVGRHWVINGAALPDDLAENLTC